MARNGRVLLLREQRVHSFADDVLRFSGENFRWARAASYDFNCLVLYVLVAKIVGDYAREGSACRVPLTLRRLMSYIYMEHPFLMFLDHTQRRSTVGRTPLDE